MSNKETVIIQNASNQSVENLIKRGNFALEDKKWKLANSFFEQALNQNPECAEAYLGKLLVDFKTDKIANLSSFRLPLDDNVNYKRIIQFGSCELIHQLEIQNSYIHNSIKIKKRLQAKKIKCAAIVFAIVAVILVVSITTVSIVSNYVSLNEKYQKALSLIEEEKYIEATAILCTISGYKDSSTKISEIEELRKNKYMSIISDAKIGSTIKFGTYEQDSNTDNGKEQIEWIVLDRQDNKILCISKYALDTCSYGKESSNMTVWENCSLRIWLNDSFYRMAFDNTESPYIIESVVSADDNPYAHITQGKDTLDKVFLLSLKEINQYFPSSDKRKCRTTAFAGQGGYCFWWSRTIYSKNYAHGVDASGQIEPNEGGLITYVPMNNIRLGCYVRPVIWLSVE